MPPNVSSSFQGRRGAPPERPALAIWIPIPFHGPYILFLTMSQILTYTLGVNRLVLSLGFIFFPDRCSDYLDLSISDAQGTFFRLFAARGVVQGALLIATCYRYGKKYLRGSLVVMRLVLALNVAADMVAFGILGSAGISGDLPVDAALWLIWETMLCLALGLGALIC